jgi:DNA-binding Lrp family transcriptional regulator
MQFFIFIRCKPGKTNQVAMSIVKKERPEVQEVHSISGEWDLMVRAKIASREGEADFEANVMEVLLADQWEHIQRTQTIVGFRVYNPDDAGFE